MLDAMATPMHSMTSIRLEMTWNWMANPSRAAEICRIATGAALIQTRSPTDQWWMTSVGFDSALRRPER